MVKLLILMSIAMILAAIIPGGLLLLWSFLSHGAVPMWGKGIASIIFVLDSLCIFAVMLYP